ncbi:DeoR/GlpR transcriptional regulator [Paenibacillus rhizovicinus]|uniref:DeoR/GlpR transcriptional regulator n=1 Tax=Paenibacillus rhizovicinus TaxID=2704463 RepID=A0A6C0PAT8_9BACL|nr:DeoR/GlpR family DNA-binding transcription regulator [Paenibacillus rhizovicinus]QHW33672.1 DeoR/GlpR transcriptional regulator [Paenibacillus rhizovicinus]
MIVAHRRNKIKEQLLLEKSVKVAELVKTFNVSEETIRRDLHQLEIEGIVQKNYGGAILIDDIQQISASIPPVQQRKFKYFEEKEAIGRKAAELVQENQIVIIDSGSTTWCVARHLKMREGLVAVTNGINIAEELLENEGSEVFLLGGKVIKKSMSLVGPVAEAELQHYNADYVFMGTTGISLRKGFTSSDIYEAEIKRAMVAAGQKVVVVADHSKFQAQALIAYSAFKDVDILVTSSLADPIILAEIRKLGVQVIACDVE